MSSPFPALLCASNIIGNVSALDLAKDGCLDILSSDYIPSSLLMAVFLLVDQASKCSVIGVWLGCDLSVI
jgi:alpha-D-ribose 1-methylphosphonate 5-triphosphate diphosphatase PhnM